MRSLEPLPPPSGEPQADADEGQGRECPMLDAFEIAQEPLQHVAEEIARAGDERRP